MTPSDDSNDPLTAPSWPTGAFDDSVLDPHTTEQLPDDDAMRTRRSVPKPPDVDQILRGEYTGWVPVIKAGESQVDAEVRAQARIRRIEAELDAQDDSSGARSVSMWIPSNTGVVPLPPKAAPQPPAQVKVAPPRSISDINAILDPPWEGASANATVLSPAQALDEARKRIRQMREDLESNVEMVTRSFEHSVFQVPQDFSQRDGAMPVQQLFDDPVLPDDDELIVLEYSDIQVTPSAPPSPVVIEAITINESPAVDIATDEVIVDESDALVEAHSSSDDSRPLDDIADAIEAVLDGSDDALEAMLATLGQSRSQYAEVASMDTDDEVIQSSDRVDVADEVIDDSPLPQGDSSVTDLMDTFEPSSPTASDSAAILLGDALGAPMDVVAGEVLSALDHSDREEQDSSLPIGFAPMPTGGIDDSEAKFLSDLLSTLDEVEATVTRIASSTALDDVLAKYSDILNSETPTAGEVTDADVMAAVEVQAKAEQNRANLNEMIRSLKAAAGDFSDEESSQGVADVAEVLQGLLSNSPEGTAVAATSAAAAPTAIPTSAPTERNMPPRKVSPDSPRVERVPVRPVVIEPAVIEVPAYEAPGAPEPELIQASVTQAQSDQSALVETELPPRTVDQAPAASAAIPNAAQVNNDAEPEPIVQMTTPAAPAADSVNALLANLVDNALRPLDLPTIFQGEPKRLTPAEHVEALRAAKAENAARGTAAMSGRAGARPATPQPPQATPQPTTPSAPASSAPAPKATTPRVAPPQPLSKDPSSREENEIDKIIEAAAERVNSRGQSFWDDEDADDLVEGAPSAPGSATSWTAPAATSRQTPEPGLASTQSPEQQPISGAKQDEQPDRDRSARAHSARVDENFFSQSHPATTYVLSDQAPKDNSLELVIMRDEIRDLRDRLDSSQKLIEDLMLRLANLTEIALQSRQN